MYLILSCLVYFEMSPYSSENILFEDVADRSEKEKGLYTNVIVISDLSTALHSSI